MNLMNNENCINFKLSFGGNFNFCYIYQMKYKNIKLFINFLKQWNVFEHVFSELKFFFF